MNVPQDAMVIMYSSAKLFIQERIKACEELGRSSDDYKLELEIVEKAWSNYMKGVSEFYRST